MDCSKTEVFLAEWNRMCKATSCGRCGLYGKEGTCRFFTQSKPEEAIAIVQEWSDANQPKTRLSVLLEAFPNAVMKSKGDLPLSCARLIFGFDENECEKKSCAECWNTPIEDGGNNA